MVRIRAKIENFTLFGGALGRIKGKIERIRVRIEKTPFVVSLWLRLEQIEKITIFGKALIKGWQNRENILFGKALVRIWAKIYLITLFGRALFRIRANIEKHTLFGWALIRIRA